MIEEAYFCAYRLFAIALLASAFAGYGVAGWFAWRFAWHSPDMFPAPSSRGGSAERRRRPADAVAPPQPGETGEPVQGTAPALDLATINAGLRGLVAESRRLQERLASSPGGCAQRMIGPASPR